MELSAEELLFFEGHAGVLPLYLQARERLFQIAPGARIEVKKTQITFRLRRTFAVVSFLPVRRAAERPADYLTLSFGLPYAPESTCIDAAVQTGPRRWTCHTLISRVQELTPLLPCLEQAKLLAK